MPGSPGIVVVDSTFLKDLKRPESIARIESAMRVAHLELAPSVPNVLEALKHPNREIREELLHGIRRWTNDRPLNPWPLDLLRLAGEALPSTEFLIGPANIDDLIQRPDELQADHEKAVEYLNGIQGAFSAALLDNRLEFQATLKKLRLKYAWPDVGSFLDSPDWSSHGNIDHLVAVLWDLSALPGAHPGIDVVRRSEAWRIAIDAFGAATYAHSIRADKQANPPGFVDLMQLVYLSQHTRSRIFVTDDRSLRQTAAEMFRGRYINIRIISGAEFLE